MAMLFHDKVASDVQISKPVGNTAQANSTWLSQGLIIISCGLAFVRCLEVELHVVMARD